LDARGETSHRLGESEAFLLELAVTAPLVWNAILMSRTSPL
jgi:hypothetical protein